MKIKHTVNGSVFTEKQNETFNTFLEQLFNAPCSPYENLCEGETDEETARQINEAVTEFWRGLKREGKTNDQSKKTP